MFDERRAERNQAVIDTGELLAVAVRRRSPVEKMDSHILLALYNFESVG